MITSYAGNDEAVKEYLARNGNKVEVPDDVIKQQRGGAYIERKVRAELAREQEIAEREAADQEVLNARIATVEADEVEPVELEEEPQMVTPEQATMLANAAMHGAGAVASHAVRAEEKQLQLEQATERLKQESESTLSSLQEQQAVLLEEVKLATERANQATAELESYKAATKEELWSELDDPRFVGPKGSTGATGGFGAGFGYADSSPDKTDPVSAGKKWFGRKLVPSDNLIRPVEGGLEFWRTPDGKSWQKVDFRTNKQDLVSNKWMAHADLKTSYSSNTTIKSGGGGSTPLTTQVVNAAVGRGAQRIADGAAYGAELERTGQFCNAAQVLIRATALDGPDAGKSNYAVFDLLVEGNTATSDTVSAELGSLGATVSLTLTPGGSGSVPAWAPNGATSSTTNTPVISLTVDSNTSGANQFAVEGAVTWVMPIDGGQPLRAAW